MSQVVKQEFETVESSRNMQMFHKNNFNIIQPWKTKFIIPASFLFWHYSEHSSLQVKTVSRSKLMKLKVLAFSSFHTYNDKWTMWSSNSWQAATIAGQEIETTSLKDFHFLLFHNPPFTYFFGVNLLYMDRLMVKELWWST